MAEKKINNKTLAEISGVHPTTISRLKNVDGLKQISSDILNALCNALECTPNDLLEFTPDNPPSLEAQPESDSDSSVIEFKQSSSRKKNTSFPKRNNQRREAIA